VEDLLVYTPRQPDVTTAPIAPVVEYARGAMGVCTWTTGVSPERVGRGKLRVGTSEAGWWEAFASFFFFLLALWIVVLLCGERCRRRLSR
jgi:hypothetical protein